MGSSARTVNRICGNRNRLGMRGCISRSERDPCLPPPIWNGWSFRSIGAISETWDASQSKASWRHVGDSGGVSCGMPILRRDG